MLLRRHSKIKLQLMACVLASSLLPCALFAQNRPDTFSSGVQAADCFALAQRVEDSADILWSDLEICDQAILVLDLARDLPAREVQSLFINRAIVATELGLFKQALQDFERALAIDSDPAPVYLNRGASYLLQQDYHSAIADFSWITTHPDFGAQALYNRALAYHYSGDSEAATADFQQLYRDFPAKYDLWVAGTELESL